MVFVARFVEVRAALVEAGSLLTKLEEITLLEPPKPPAETTGPWAWMRKAYATTDLCGRTEEMTQL